MPPKVPSSDTGTAMLGMSVERALRRNKKTTRMTSDREISRVISTSRTDARIVVVALSTTESFTVGGIEARSKGKISITRSTVSMILAPGSR